MSTPVTNKKLPSEFWDRWYHADELGRLGLVRQLTGMEDHATATLTNSYLADLAEHLERTMAVEGTRLSRKENQLWRCLPLSHKVKLLTESGITDTGTYDFLEIADLALLLSGLRKLTKSLRSI